MRLSVALLCMSLGMVKAVTATELSGHLSEGEIKEAGKILGLGAAHRAWTAPAVSNDDLGLDLGLESTFIYRRDLNDMGDGTAVIPGYIPVPRLWFAWDLPANFQISGSYAPGALFDGINALGIAGQFTFFRDDNTRAAMSALLGYTYVEAFGDLRTHVTDIAAQATRDLDQWQPYIGVGVLIGNTTVKNSREAYGVDPGPYTIPAVHVYVGANLNISGKFAFQLDLAGDKFSGALLIANRF